MKQYEKIHQCPICKSDELQSVFECKDFTVSQEVFPIVRCNSCGHLFTNPRPFSKDLGAYYKSDTYISHSDTSKGIINKLYKLVRTYTLRKKANRIMREKQSGALLDIGCGTGAFLNEMKKHSFRVQGIEPDEETADYARKRYELDVRGEEDLQLLSDASFDIITMWHVLEHVSFPVERMKELFRLLKPDGYIFIAVPNPSSLDAKRYGPNWAAYDVPRHLQHYTPDILDKLAQSTGFEIVKSYAMPLDGYYVSILTETHLKRGAAFFRGILSGLRAHLHASNVTSSSITYVLRKRLINA